MIEDYKKLVKLVSAFQVDKGPKELYALLEKFLQDVYQLESLFVYSVYDNSDRPEGAPIPRPRYMRTLWQRKEAQAYIEVQENRELITDVLMEKKTPEDLGQRFYLPLGTIDHQFVFAYGPLDKPIPKDVYDHLCEFFARSFKMMNKWQEVSKLESLVYIDDVTGLFNQRKLIKDIKSCVENYKSRKEEFVVLFIDIDHFKTINDSHGHLVGTQVLSGLASLLMGLMRDSDLCYRYGGDEFVVIIPDETSKSGQLIGKRVLNAVKHHAFEIDKALLTREQRELHKEGPMQLSFSVSIGVAGFPQDAKTEHEVLAIADKMMYEAKQSGRGKVCFAQDLFKNKTEEA